MDAIASILNLATVIWYIIYLDRIHHFTDGGEDNNLGRAYLYFLKAGHLYFLMDFLLRLITAKNPKKFVLSGDSAIEIITIFPFLCIALPASSIEGTATRFCMMLDTLRTFLGKRLFNELQRVCKGRA